MEKNIIEDLTNYIMSVQSLIDRLNIYEKDNKIDFSYINKRIDILQQYEDNLICQLGKVIK